MTSTVRPFSFARFRQRLALFMALAVLVGGIAQAAHYHKGEFGQHSEVHLQCLLCLHSAGSAGPPAVPQVVPAAEVYRPYVFSYSTPAFEGVAVASYDARGPPQV